MVGLPKISFDVIFPIGDRRKPYWRVHYTLSDGEKEFFTVHAITGKEAIKIVKEKNKIEGTIAKKYHAEKVKISHYGL
jgi:hypothetical protein